MSSTFVYGKNFRILRKIYITRHGNQKGLNAFINEVLMPISEANGDGEIEIISETKALELVKTLYNNWLTRNRLYTWEEIARHVDYTLYCSGGKSHCFTGTIVAGKKLKPHIEY